MVGFAKMGSDIYWKSDGTPPENPLWPMSILLVAIIALTVFAAPVMSYLSDARMFDLPAYIAVQNLGGM
jgi:formate hydrogenlyase subunit 3/multisubunit Na+/H+ antiporter MnhD subunit